MAENNEYRANIDEIMASIKEYTKEDINDPKAAKLKIKKFLKTHRPIKLADYQYGFSLTGKKDHRLIVKEENDKTKVREFSKQSNSWRCYFRTSKCLHSLTMKFEYGIIFAPIKHDTLCTTKEYFSVMKIQDLLKQGKINEARGLAFAKKLSLNDTLNQSSTTSILDESNSTMDMENDSVLDQSVAYDKNDESIVSNILPSETQISTLTSVENVQESGRLCVKRESDDTEYCMEIIQPPAKKPKTESTDDRIFSFEYPSSNTIKEICKKVNIEYDRNVYKFWSDIAYEKIVPVSENIKTHSFKTPNIFACFSQFFTGKTKSCFDLQKVINTAFEVNLVDLGVKSGAEIEEICTNITVTDEHLEFIAKFLSCRIGTFESGNLKKYGNWETKNNNALTLILSFENGLYSVVLDL